MAPSTPLPILIPILDSLALYYPYSPLVIYTEKSNVPESVKDRVENEYGVHFRNPDPLLAPSHPHVWALSALLQSSPGTTLLFRSLEAGSSDREAAAAREWMAEADTYPVHLYADHPDALVSGGSGLVFDLLVESESALSVYRAAVRAVKYGAPPLRLRSFDAFIVPLLSSMDASSPVMTHSSAPCHVSDAVRPFLFPPSAPGIQGESHVVGDVDDALWPVSLAHLRDGTCPSLPDAGDNENVGGPYVIAMGLPGSDDAALASARANVKALPALFPKFHLRLYTSSSDPVDPDVLAELVGDGSLVHTHPVPHALAPLPHAHATWALPVLTDPSVLVAIARPGQTVLSARDAALVAHWLNETGAPLSVVRDAPAETSFLGSGLLARRGIALSESVLTALHTAATESPSLSLSEWLTTHVLAFLPPKTEFATYLGCTSLSRAGAHAVYSISTISTPRPPVEKGAFVGQLFGADGKPQDPEGAQSVLDNTECSSGDVTDTPDNSATTPGDTKGGDGGGKPKDVFAYNPEGGDGLYKVASFGLYGGSPRYTVGAVENAKMIKENFPGWVARFYVDDSVPSSVIEELESLGAEIERDVKGLSGGIAGMYWRFLVSSDPEVDIYIIRDADSRLTVRDKMGVDEWLASDKLYHVIRDHPSHSNFFISGGLWGGRKTIPDILELMRDPKADKNSYVGDMHFLGNKVWPMIKESVFQHDAYSCVKYGGKGNPQPRPPSGEHIGAVYQNGVMRAGDVAIIHRSPEPPECHDGTYHPLP